MEPILHVIGVCGHGVGGHPSILSVAILVASGAFTGIFGLVRYYLSPYKKAHKCNNHR